MDDAPDSRDDLDPSKIRITLPVKWIGPLITAAEGGILNLDAADDQKVVYSALDVIEKAAQQ